MSTLSHEKPTICSAIGTIASSENPSFWNVFQYNMLTELSWSTSVFIIAKFTTSTVISIGSSWSGSIPLQSTSEKVMGGMLHCHHRLTEWADWIALKCHFQVEYEAPPPPNPKILLMTTRRGSTCRSGTCGRLELTLGSFRSS